MLLTGLALSISLSGPADSRLEWDAPASCPDAAQVQRRAAALAGLDATAGAAAPSVPVRARIEARDTPSRTPWRLTLSVGDAGAEQTRTLDAAHCEALADVTALVLAFGLDPFGPASEPANASASPQTQSPVPAQPVAPTHPVQRRRRSGPELSTHENTTPAPSRSPHAGVDEVGFGLRLLAGGELGALPGGSGGGRLAAALLTRRFRIEAHGGYWLPRPARLDDSGMGVDVRLATGGLDVCVRLYAARRLELPICAGAELGLMRGDAVGTPEPQRAHSLYAAARLAPAISWRVADWVGLWLGVEGTLALARPRFRIDEDAVYTPAPAGGRVLAGVEFGF